MPDIRLEAMGHAANHTLAPPLIDGCGCGEERLRAWAQRRGGRVLVVDDSPVERAVTVSALEKAGFKVISAADGREAVEIVRDAPLPFDAVVMDVSMPDLDGIAAARSIRALPGPRRHVPIIALTSNTSPEDCAACRDAGMNAHTAKPLRLAQLLDAMRAHLPMN